MDKISIILAIISSIIAVATLIWNIINENKKNKLKKEIEILRGKINRGDYVSNAVFDKLFFTIGEITKSLFINYNNVAIKMFPRITYSSQSNYMEMVKIKNKAELDLNNLIELIHINRFIFNEDIIIELENFEKKMKYFFKFYENKINDECVGDSKKILSQEKLNLLCDEASEVIEVYKKIEIIFKELISGLTIVN